MEVYRRVWITRLRHNDEKWSEERLGLNLCSFTSYLVAFVGDVVCGTTACAIGSAFGMAATVELPI